MIKINNIFSIGYRCNVDELLKSMKLREYSYFFSVGNAICPLFPDNSALHAEGVAAFSEHMDYQNHHNNIPHTTAIRHPHFAFVYSTNLQHTNPPRVLVVYSHSYEIIPMHVMHAEIFPPHHANFSIQQEEPNFPFVAPCFTRDTYFECNGSVGLIVLFFTHFFCSS